MPRLITSSRHNALNTHGVFYILQSDKLFCVTDLVDGGGTGETRQVFDVSGERRYLAAPSTSDLVRLDSRFVSEHDWLFSPNGGLFFLMGYTEAAGNIVPVFPGAYNSNLMQDMSHPEILWSVSVSPGAGVSGYNRINAYFSINKGETWTKVMLSDAFSTGTMFVAPRHDGFSAFVGVMATPTSSTPGGYQGLRVHLVDTTGAVSWVDIDSAGESLFHDMSQGVVIPGDADNLIMCNVDGTALKFWDYTASSGGFGSLITLSDGAYKRLVVTPGGSLIIPRANVAGATTLHLKRSTNGGISWYDLDFSYYVAGLSGVSIVVVAANYSGRLFFALETGLGFFSDDDGATWFTTADFIPHTDAVDVAGAMAA